MSDRRSPTYRDLSHPIESGMTTFPGDPTVTITPAASIDEDGVSVHELRCGSHTGTHIDAPCHTESGGETLEDRAIGEYAFDARLVDATPCEPREPIDEDRLPSDIADEVDLVVVRTGWDDHWNAESYLDHPYLTPDAAKHLREADCGVAVDALNPDPSPTGNATADEPDGFPVHGILLGDDLPILENLTGLDGLPERFTLYAFPLPIVDGDGAPVRAVAAVDSRDP